MCPRLRETSYIKLFLGKSQAPLLSRCIPTSIACSPTRCLSNFAYMVKLGSSGCGNEVSVMKIC